MVNQSLKAQKFIFYTDFLYMGNKMNRKSSQSYDLRKLIIEKKRLDKEDPDRCSVKIVIASLEELEGILIRK